MVRKSQCPEVLFPPLVIGHFGLVIGHSPRMRDAIRAGDNSAWLSTTSLACASAARVAVPVMAIEVIPARLAASIPGGAALTFEIELLEIAPVAQ